MRRWSFGPVLLGLALMLLFVGAGCRCSRTPPPAAVSAEKPSLRLYLVSSLAGALEPCGCVKDMLGGADHFAALLANEASHAPSHLVLGAGPLFYMDPELDAKRGAQDRLKAKALAELLAGAKLAAWAPGANDWAGGAEFFAELEKTGIQPLAANLDGKGIFRTKTFEVGGERIGVAGVSSPAFPRGTPDGLKVSDTREALGRAKEELDKAGARIRVALLAVPRGEALRLAETVPGFQVVLVGKTVDRGESNDPPTPPVKIGDTLVVQAPNHLQAVAVVDLFVEKGGYTFADATGIESEERKLSLKQRVHELEAAIARPGILAADREARRNDLGRLQKELAELDKERPRAEGSAFRYRLVEVREKLGTEPKAAARLAEFYRQVNEHNRVAFKDVLPAPVPEGQSDYVGIEQCSTCHQSQRAFWDKSAHHGAYETLVRQNKQFNLECVGCHVTGYEAPGGSTVSHVEGLESVQCEVCHGPGSRHLANPADKKLILMPERSECASKCHHPPHVKSTWSVDDAWKLIIGPGHERKRSAGR